jgi:hypothetical protein
MYYEHVRLALQSLLSIGVMQFSAPREFVTVFSDASLYGFGYVGGTPEKSHCGAWRKTFSSRDIFYLEAIAAKKAVAAFQKPARRVTVVTDNMALFWCMRKRSTACPRTARVLHTLFENHPDVDVEWISTDLNPADPLSRGLPHSAPALDRALRLVQTTPSVERGPKGRVVG